MTNVTTYTKTGTKADTTTRLNDAVFGVEANHGLIGQAYRTYLSNGRSARATTLERGDVRGGGKKPHRQKGTGRARVGSSRVPNWRGGGVVFGPTGNENYVLALPTKMKRSAIRGALSLKATASVVSVVESFDVGDGKTKAVQSLLTKLGVRGNVVVVVADKTDLMHRATRNISGLKVVTANYLNVFTIMNADAIVFEAAALGVVDGWLGESK